MSRISICNIQLQLLLSWQLVIGSFTIHYITDYKVIDFLWLISNALKSWMNERIFQR